MFNGLLLEMVITRSQISKRDLAKKLGISEQGLYNKLNAISEFQGKRDSHPDRRAVSVRAGTRRYFFCKRVIIYHSLE